MHPNTRDRIEWLVSRLTFATLIAIAVCDLVPIVVLEITKMVMAPNTPRGEIPAGYPPFDPLVWLAWIPVVLFAFAVILSIPVPYTRARGMGRWFMLVLAFLVLVSTFARITWVPEYTGTWGTNVILAVVLVVTGVVIVRILAGGLRLVPKAWRVYLDEHGRVEQKV